MLGVLQLDTRFPRRPGDIGSAQTFRDPVDIRIVPNAHVDQIVTDSPSTIDPQPFVDVAKAMTADMITTSCGFLAPLQQAIARQLPVPFVASSLTALPQLLQTYGDDGVLIVTFDGLKLSPQHYGTFTDGMEIPTIGLRPDMHLFQVIRGDHPELNQPLAEKQIIDLLRRAVRPQTKAILLECTNLPPYKTAIAQATDLPVFDILDVLENKHPNLVQPQFLSEAKL